MQSKILRDIYEFNKNPVEKVKIVLEEFRRRQYVDVRVYYDSSNNAVPDWKPTRKGICLSLELLEELYEGIKQALSLIKKDRRQKSGSPVSSIDKEGFN